MLLGAHIPTAGGLALAPARGRSIAADVIQIFTRSQLQWAARPLEGEEAAAFREAMTRSGLRLALAHGSYLVNLATPDPDALRRSREAFLEEMRRCHALGLPYLVFHPGAHRGAGVEAGLDTIAQSLDLVLERGEGLAVMPLLEVTAGQGTSLGHRFEHLTRILDRVRRPERLGLCLDTCHLLAAGYDLVSPGGYERTLAELQRRVGLERVRAFHLNDAQAPRGSHLDRHAPIGEGFLGRTTFARLVADPRFRDIPMVLETPGGLGAWRKELRLLRRLAQGPRTRRHRRV